MLFFLILILPIAKRNGAQALSSPIMGISRHLLSLIFNGRFMYSKNKWVPEQKTTCSGWVEVLDIAPNLFGLFLEKDDKLLSYLFELSLLLYLL